MKIKNCKIQSCQGENCLPHCPCDCHLSDDELDKKVLFADWYEKGKKDALLEIKEQESEIRDSFANYLRTHPLACDSPNTMADWWIDTIINL